MGRRGLSNRSGIAAAAVAAAVFLLSSPASAGPSIRAYTNRASVEANGTFMLMLEVSGSDIGALEIPDIDGARLVTRSPSSSQIQMTMDGARMTQTRKLGYVVQAMRSGRITIPPVTAVVDGQTVASDPVIVTVTAAGQDPNAGGPPPGAQAQPSPPRGAREPTLNDVVKAESAVDKTTVYQGEPVLLTLSALTLRCNLQVQLGRIAFPSAEGFYAVPLGQEREHIERDGFQYEVTKFTEVLYPTAAGELTIGSWHLDASAMRSIFEQHPYSLDTPPITVTVLPLPEKPAHFTGAVGSFQLQAFLSRPEVIQGSAATLTVRVTGKGNPDAVGAPTLTKTEHLHAQDPEVESAKAPQLGPFGIEKKFTYSLIALEPGELQVPAVEFCYFDPEAKEYKTLTAGPFPLRVVKSAEATGQNVVSTMTPVAAPRGRVNVVGDDIRPLVTDPGRLRPHGSLAVLAGVLFPAPVLAYAALALTLRRRRRFEQDTGYARQYFARSKIQKRLKDVYASSEPTEALYKAVSEFVADKFSLPSTGITSADARQAMEARNITPEIIDTFVRVMKACERARYASASLSAEEAGALTQAASVAVERLESEWKGGRAGK